MGTRRPEALIFMVLTKNSAMKWPAFLHMSNATNASKMWPGLTSSLREVASDNMGHVSAEIQHRRHQRSLKAITACETRTNIYLMLRKRHTCRSRSKRLPRTAEVASSETQRLKNLRRKRTNSHERVTPVAYRQLHYPPFLSNVARRTNIRSVRKSLTRMDPIVSMLVNLSASLHESVIQLIL